MERLKKLRVKTTEEILWDGEAPAALAAERAEADRLLAEKDKEIGTLRKALIRTMEMGDFIEEDLRRATGLAKSGRKEGAKNVVG